MDKQAAWKATKALAWFFSIGAAGVLFALALMRWPVLWCLIIFGIPALIWWIAYDINKEDN